MGSDITGGEANDDIDDLSGRNLGKNLNKAKRGILFYKEKIRTESNQSDAKTIKKYEAELKKFEKMEKKALEDIKSSFGVVSTTKIQNTVFQVVEGCGLFSKTKGKDADGGLSHPLESVKHTIEVINNIATIMTEQKFVNRCEKPVEMIYRYPLLFSSTPHRVAVEITDPDEGKKWRFDAKCEEKVKAAEKYDDAISEGKSAVLMTKGDGDHIKLNLGLIKPQYKIRVLCSVIQEMEMEITPAGDLRMKVTIPAIHNKKDDGAAQRARNKLPQKIQSVEGSISNLNGKQVKKMSSPSHPSSFEFTYSEEDNKIDFVTKELLGMDRECVLHLELGSPQFMTSVIEKCAQHNESTISVSVNPILDEILKDNESTVPMEHILLLDRSGSMGTQRMQYAVQSLELFIKSLDVDSEPRVNLIGFGSRMEKLYNESRVLDEKTFVEILKHVSGSKSNLGGTNMTNPIRFIVNQLPVPEGFFRVVYLLTDGEADNPTGVTDLVKENSNKLKIFSFGIGQGINPSFLTNLSRMTNGRAVMIEKEEQIQPFVIEQLNYATQGMKCLFQPQVSLSGPSSEVSWTRPLPKVLIPSRRINLYGWVKSDRKEEEQEGEEEDDEEEEMQVILKYKLGKDDEEFEELRAPLLPSKSLDGAQYFPVNPIGTYTGMNRVEYLESGGKKKDNDAKKEILKLSLKYHFLSSQTSFVGVKEEDGDEDEEALQDELEVVDVTTVPYVSGGDTEYTVKQLTKEEFMKKEKKEKEMRIRAAKKKKEEMKRRKIEESKKKKKMAASKKVSYKRKMSKVCSSSEDEEESDDDSDSDDSDSESESDDSDDSDDMVRSMPVRKKTSVMKMMEDAPAPVSYGMSYSSSVSNTKRASGGSEGSYRKIVSTQKFLGNWEFSEIIKFLKISNEVKEEFDNNGYKKDMLGFWTTAVVIAILMLKFKEKENEWNLMVKKSRKYLAKKGHDGMLPKAEEFVKNLSIPSLK